MSHQREHVDGDSGDEGIIQHGMHIVSDFFHGRKHVHHHEGHGHEHGHHGHHDSHSGSQSGTPSKGSLEEKREKLEPREEPTEVHVLPQDKHDLPPAREEPKVPAPEPKVEPIPVPVPEPAPAPEEPAQPRAEETAAQPERTPEPTPVSVEAVVPASPVAPVEPVAPAPVPAPKSGPILELPYHLFCWGTPDSITKSTSYLIAPLPSTFLTSPNSSSSGSFTLAVSARTEQDGPRTIISLEDPSLPSSLLWAGTEHTNLVHVQWPGGAAAGEPGEGGEGRVAWHVGWSTLVVVWDAQAALVSVWHNGRLAFRRPLSEEAVKLAGEVREPLLVLGRAKEAGKRVLGWDGEIADAKVWDRALEAGEAELVSRQKVGEVHKGYESAWNDGFA